MAEHDPYGAFGDHYVPYVAPDPRLELIETCWQLRGPSGRTLTGSIWRNVFGIEVRVSYEEHDLVYAHMMPSLEAARAKAVEVEAVGHRHGRL